jgi:membrane-associated protease RseP (regulator of RpoE activity)
VNKKVEQYTNFFGMAVLLLLIGLITVGDIIKLITDLLKK